MDAALEVEPEIQGGREDATRARGRCRGPVEIRPGEGGRVQVEEGADDDGGDDPDPEREAPPHQAAPSLSPAAGTMRPMADRSSWSLT